MRWGYREMGEEEEGMEERGFLDWKKRVFKKRSKKTRKMKDHFSFTLEGRGFLAPRESGPKTGQDEGQVRSPNNLCFLQL